jgi:hypothetical protein
VAFVPSRESDRLAGDMQEILMIETIAGERSVLIPEARPLSPQRDNVPRELTCCDQQRELL